VVRRDDDLVGSSCVFEDGGITRAARRCLVILVADMARSYPEFAQRTRDTPREQFVEEQPDGGSPRRGATSYLANTFAASSWSRSASSKRRAASICSISKSRSNAMSSTSSPTRTRPSIVVVGTRVASTQGVPA
jgi:hypothetical protein